MAKKTDLETKSNKDSGTSSSDKAVKLHEEWQKADQELQTVRDTIWRPNEKLFFDADRGKLAGQTAKSNTNDGHLSTAIIQRTQRVMAQPATGNIKSLDDPTNLGKSILLNTIFEKYVKPNANSGRKLAAKLKQVSMLSHIYGSQPVLVTKEVRDDYIGPDFRVIPIDQWYPEPGVFAPQDMNYTFVDSFVTKDWLLNQSKSVWTNIDKLIDAIKDKEGKSKSSYAYQSYAESKWGGIGYGGKGKFAKVLIRTKYMKDRWITYAPDYTEAGILRDIENPQSKGKLPIVVKETIPLIDRVVGRGDVERGGPSQRTANSLMNLMLDTSKFGMMPPTIVNSKGVVKSSMKWEPGVFWEEIIPNSIRTHQTSPQSLQWYSNAYGTVVSNLNNMLGASDLSTQKDVDQTMGKTPAAVKMQASRESAADSWERQTIEDFTEELFEQMVDILANKSDKPIDMTLFAGEIEKIAQSYPDVSEMVEVVDGKLVINPDQLEGSYKFFIDSGSTVQKDTQMENQAITSVMSLILNPQVGQVLLQSMHAKGKDIDVAEIVQRWISTSGIQGTDKIITDYKPQIDPMTGQPIDPMQVQPMNNQGGMNTPAQGPQFDMSQIQDPEIAQAAQQLFGGGMTQPNGLA